MKTSVILLIALLSSGCASNDFSKFYHDNTSTEPADAVAKRLYPYTGSTQILSTKNHDADAENLTARGFVCIGFSAFEGAGAVTEKQLKQHAAKVGADIVLWGSSYLGAEQGAVPFLQYNPGQVSTTTSSGTAHVNMHGGGDRSTVSANYSGTSTTTTPGTFSTHFVPRTFHRYGHSATFWRRSKPRTLGVYWEVLPNTLREQFARNTGAYVTLVIIDSPAFRANILKGDIITHIGDVEVMSPAEAGKQLEGLAGQNVRIRVLRKGQLVDVEVQLNPPT